ncbi:unnamed protein product [Hydatigera taeniaeformis]|uniref:Protein kinase domain-containing protein n=1 Tax=Hydatigena taeniaeformis TaxID=6205 RepID=A0A0R3WLK0_HYDTA|nr:unnamed protein product [Hydatigera taeniaeformis]
MRVSLSDGELRIGSLPRPPRVVGKCVGKPLQLWIWLELHLFEPSVVFYDSKPRAVATTTPSAQTSGTTTPASIESMAACSPWMTATRGSQQAALSLPPTSQSLSFPAQPALSSRKHTTLSSSSSSSSSISSQEVHSTAGVLESLLMGGYVAPDSRHRRISGSSVATATTTTTTIAIAARHRNASEAASVDNGCGVSECRQALSGSGPSSTCCQVPKSSSCFSFNGVEWPMATSTINGSSNTTSPTTSTRNETPNSTPHLLMSPISSSSCSSLAHLLRHGCPPASVVSANATVTTSFTLAPTTTLVTAVGVSEPIPSPTISTACAVRASRLAASAAVGATSRMAKVAPSRPLDCPLSIIVDPQPPSGAKSTAHRPPSCKYFAFNNCDLHVIDEYWNSVADSVSSVDFVDEDGLSPKIHGPPPSKLPSLAPQTMDSRFLTQETANNNIIGNLQLQNNASSGGSTGVITRKANIRDTSEDEDAALANSSLCRLLQGPDPRWETVTAEVDATVQEDVPVAPPPPPPSFFELPSDVLVVSSGGSGEVRRTRYDSCPMALRQPLSVPTPSHVLVTSVPPSQSVAPTVKTPVAAKGSIGGCVVIGSGASGGSCCRGSSSSAPPSAVNSMDVSNSSPVTLERNRRAAAAAAAQIAEEAEHQRRQRPSSRHLLERQRLLFQQNVGQVTTYGSGSHSLLEGTLGHHHHQQQRQQQQSLPNCGFSSSGSDVPSSSSTAACCHIQSVGGEGFCELDAPLLTPTPVTPASQTQTLVNQRTPLEDFSRRMKEIAPNVRVSPTGYHHHFPVPTLYPPDQQEQHQQQRMSQLQPVYEYSGGHLAPVNYEYQDHQQTGSSPQGLLTGTSPHYDNPALGSPPPYTPHPSPIQPKLLSHHQYHNLQHHTNSHHPHQCQQQLHRQSQQPYYNTQAPPHHQQQQHLLYHQQRPSLPQSPSPHTVCGSETYANFPSMGYFDSQFSFQHQHHTVMHQQPPPQPPNYVSPLSLALQQNQSLPHSQVKASLREKVTSRCQVRNMDIMATGSSPPPPPTSAIPTHSAGLAVSAMIGQKRPHPPDSLKGGIGGGGDKYFYNPPPPHHPSPPHYHQSFEQVGSEMDLPFLDGSTYEGYEISRQQAPLPTQPPSPQRHFTERRPSMLFEAQQCAPVCDSNSVDSTNGITTVNNNTDCSNKVNEDIQLTADIVNDVLECKYSNFTNLWRWSRLIFNVFIGFPCKTSQGL